LASRPKSYLTTPRMSSTIASQYDYLWVGWPGSTVEEGRRDALLAWHYRMSDPGMASSLAKQLVDGLVSFTANIDLQVVRGNKVVEARNAGVSKGKAGLCLLKKCDLDFVLAKGTIGPMKIYSRRCLRWRTPYGWDWGRPYARHSLHRHEDVIPLLEELAS